MEYATIPSHSINARTVVAVPGVLPHDGVCVGGAAFLSHSSVSASKLCAPSTHTHILFASIIINREIFHANFSDVKEIISSK